MVAMAAKKEVSSLQKLIQESNTEVRQLQKQLADMERNSHTEIVKMRLEVKYTVQLIPNTAYIMYHTYTV